MIPAHGNINAKGKKMYSNELYHYGVKGMKWGVRRYQNPDGTLTSAGRSRYGVSVNKLGGVSVSTNRQIGGNYTDKQKASMQKQATKVISKQIKDYDKAATSAQKASNKQSAKGNQERAKMYADMAKSAVNNSNTANQKLSDISSGTLKAGQDYVINSTYTTYPLADALGLINVQRQREVTFK